MRRPQGARGPRAPIDPRDEPPRVPSATGARKRRHHLVDERGDEGVARIKELTNGLGADSVAEAVGTQESMMQAIRAARPGGDVGFVGVGRDVALPGMNLFWSLAHLHGGPARYAASSPR